MHNFSTHQSTSTPEEFKHHSIRPVSPFFSTTDTPYQHSTGGYTKSAEYSTNRPMIEDYWSTTSQATLTSPVFAFMTTNPPITKAKMISGSTIPSNTQNRNGSTSVSIQV